MSFFSMGKGHTYLDVGGPLSSMLACCGSLISCCYVPFRCPRPKEAILMCWGGKGCVFFGFLNRYCNLCRVVISRTIGGLVEILRNAFCQVEE